MSLLQKLPPPPPSTDFAGLAWQAWFQKLRNAINETIVIAISSNLAPTAALLASGDVLMAGDVDSQIIPGPKGDQGIRGLQGVPGVDGEHGEDGFPMRGPTGAQGLTGAQGIPGMDGESYCHDIQIPPGNMQPNDAWAFAAANG